MLSFTTIDDYDRIPLTKQDQQALDEFFKNFDLDRLSQLETLVKTCFEPALDPGEETAWISGSFGSFPPKPRKKRLPL